MEEHEEHESSHMEEHEEHESPHMEEHEEHDRTWRKMHESPHMELDEEEFFPPNRLLAFARSIHTLYWHATCFIN